MDIFVPILFFSSLVLGPLLAGYGLWLLVKKGRKQGWRSLVSLFTFSAWNRFWFTPADPTVLGFIRICGGAVATYTVFAYSFMLQDFVGAHAWYDLKLRQEHVRNRINEAAPLSGQDYPLAVPTTKEEEEYQKAYRDHWGVYPPPPFPRSKEEAEFLMTFKERCGYDLRIYGIMPPTDDEQEKIDYLSEYMHHPANIYKRPPPDYPASAKEKEEIYQFMATHGGIDPRLPFYMGQPAWSIWFDVTDPTAMMAIHILAILVTFLFTVGFCTRITSVLTWVTALWYIHRSNIQLFGVDSMMMILLLYLMIGPSGAALSVDRLIARWWSRAKPGIVNRWRSLFGKPALAAASIRPAVYSAAPVPSVSANLAIRLLQIHLCVIYLVSGLSKLQGGAWWNGNAVWGTFANYEFAPMPLEIFGIQVYNEFLRWLAANKLRLELFLSVSSWFTLVFEIGYAFFIWRPNWRRIVLVGALLMHSGIGLFMGLKTFSLMMLAMNMAFLHREEVEKILSWITFSRGSKNRAGPENKPAGVSLRPAIQ